MTTRKRISRKASATGASDNPRKPQGQRRDYVMMRWLRRMSVEMEVDRLYTVD